MTISQELFFGGSVYYTMTGDIALKSGDEKIKRVIIAEPNVGAFGTRNIDLPEATFLKTGGPDVLYFE